MEQKRRNALRRAPIGGEPGGTCAGAMIGRGAGSRQPAEGTQVRGWEKCPKSGFWFGIQVGWRVWDHNLLLPASSCLRFPLFCPCLRTRVLGTSGSLALGTLSSCACRSTTAQRCCVRQRREGPSCGQAECPETEFQPCSTGQKRRLRWLKSTTDLDFGKSPRPLSVCDPNSSFACV
jgi:hypothetical protein